MKSVKKYFYKQLEKYFSFYTYGHQDICTLTPLYMDLFPVEKCPIISLNASLNQNYSYVLAEGILHREPCILSFLNQLHANCNSQTRVIFTYYSSLWRWPLAVATLLGIRSKSQEENWVDDEDVVNLLLLANFEKIHLDHRILIPIYIPFVSEFVNRYIAPLPFFRLFALVNIAVARPLVKNDKPLTTVSVIVAARNEAGNLEELAQRIPMMSGDDELIIIEGNSTDNTWDVIQKLPDEYPHLNIKIAQQSGKGKGDAVRLGFSLATRDILMILDADMTVPPEDLPMFYSAIVSGKGEYINGSRLVYPMEKEAMRFINMIGNKFFAIAFSFALGQSFKDTLCGTKVISRSNYETLARNRHFFGDFDPFGDFDLIFGAARMALKIVEVPIKYRERTYGETNISRWMHGALLFRMLFFAIKKIKFI